MNETKERNRSWEMVMSSFTDDLWIEIFLRLPIKSLLQLKSVSISWFSIISSHRFAKSHLAATTKDDEILIVHVGDSEDNNDGSFSLFHLSSGHILKNLKFPYSQGEYPFDRITSKLIGSDCGIVCVSVDVTYWRAVKKELDIYLWNPATKHSKLIPPYTIPDNNLTFNILGFGIDHIALDFKVVRVVSSNFSIRPFGVEVYSSNRNDWRKIEPKRIENPNCTNKFDVCFHGFLFATGSHGGMIAFDLNKEVFICDIKLPVSPFDGYHGFDATRIRVFKDSIAFISYQYRDKINLWTLDDEACFRGSGVEASWTKMLSIDVGVRLKCVKGLFNNVQFLLNCKVGVHFMYNSDKKVTTSLHSPPDLLHGEVLSYTESLFSLVGSKRVKWIASSSRLQDSLDFQAELDE
ncbi:F-box domain-containing protein [Heracleum sosnowskyi]|uniref:F-box domain-containing protein n=1 Tax=Heracleum sosnowskyi TaxID=360622 RepID=A0AAD8MPA3_9APIA|nr:F-box domain-containing protein [Heracleum sosnowskyi]